MMTDLFTDASQPPPATSRETRVLSAGETYTSVTDNITSIVLTEPSPWSWWIGLALSGSLLALFLYATVYLIATGIGIWGTNIPAGWAFPITNFVWWVGIGHAGTLISAFLLLAKQDWRTSINRFAEAMTIFAVMCAGMFPLLHLGRPWLFYWLAPYPNTMLLWPQFRSPLIWDFFAVLTYFTVSLLFWYAGLIPDLASLRDRAGTWGGRVAYGILAMGWRGSSKHWQRYHTMYLLLAGLAAPLVISVHSIVSTDFAMAIVPGWHSTVFPPYFVAGAILSGFAMVITLAIPLRWMYGLHDYVKIAHLSNSAKLMLVTGTIVGYAYAMEAFMAYYGDNPYERYLAGNRVFGSYNWAYFTILIANALVPQLYWFRAVRENVWALFFTALVIQYGMWLERFVIIVPSLHRDYLPSAWHMYYPTFWDFAHLFGSIGFFFFAFLLFLRFLPMISIFELREMVHDTSKDH
jgi:molybdopterin-containing oxidoreductase family membrane subunit